MFNNIDLYNEPLSIYDKFSQYKGYCEMSEFEQAFLCGMIKNAHPKKVVEIGVSAGGTTAVILNCLAMLGEDVRMYSCDLNKTYYRDSSKPVGFVAEELKPYILDRESGQAKVNHTILSGGYAPEFLPEIGKDIDFLILDTVHWLPGEMLDFIACLPYLKKGATVVLHDVSMNVTINNDAIATKFVFDTVVADKYIMKTEDRPCEFPNIAAFKITNDTYRYIRDCFSSLTITWSYMLKPAEFKLYHEFYLTEYDKDLVEVYDKAVLLQIFITCRNFKNMGIYWEVFLNKWRKAKHVIIYGCGLYGRYFYELAKSYNLSIDCFVISDGRQAPDLGDVEAPVLNLSDVQFTPDECLVLITVEKAAERSVINDLIRRGYTDIY